MKFGLKQQFRIESARHLPNIDKTHPCHRIHGHSFLITLTLEGVLDPQKGWLKDFNDVSELMAPLLKQLDHRLLNEIPGLENPTSEILAQYIYKALNGKLPELVRVAISETPNTEVYYPC